MRSIGRAYSQSGHGRTAIEVNSKSSVAAQPCLRLSDFTVSTVSLLEWEFEVLSLLLQSLRTVIFAPVETPIHCQTQSYDPISCYGNSVEGTNEIAYRIRVPG